MKPEGTCLTDEDENNVALSDLLSNRLIALTHAPDILVESNLPVFKGDPEYPVFSRVRQPRRQVSVGFVTLRV